MPKLAHGGSGGIVRSDSTAGAVNASVNMAVVESIADRVGVSVVWTADAQADLSAIPRRDIVYDIFKNALEEFTSEHRRPEVSVRTAGADEAWNVTSVRSRPGDDIQPDEAARYSILWRADAEPGGAGGMPSQYIVGHVVTTESLRQLTTE